MYKPKYFILEELVSRKAFETINHDQLWSIFDPNLLRAADWIKETFSLNSPVTINNWKWGGNRQFSGLRQSGDDYYSPTSMHSAGKALDMIFKNKTAEEIRQAIRDFEYKGNIVPYITRIEDEVTWLHIDTKSTGKYQVHFFKP